MAYGLCEWHRDGIAGAQLVANPGCYPTATLLALLPLATAGAPRHIVVDAKSGITGAGRTPQAGALFAEVSGEIRAYGLTGHRHQPEMERYLRAGGIDASVTFTPHVVPIARGLLADAYAIFDEPVDGGAVETAFRRAYASSPSCACSPVRECRASRRSPEPTTPRFASTSRERSYARSARSIISARAQRDKPFRTST